jgi:hypothetical protein
MTGKAASADINVAEEFNENLEAITKEGGLFWEANLQPRDGTLLERTCLPEHISLEKKSTPGIKDAKDSYVTCPAKGAACNCHL